MKVINLIILITIYHNIQSGKVNEKYHLSSQIIEEIKDLNSNITDLYEHLNDFKNNSLKDIDKNNFYDSIDQSLFNIKRFHTSLDQKIKKFEENLNIDSINKKNNKNLKKNPQKINIYNILSLIMLALLAGGLIGILAILYYSFRYEEKYDL